MLPSWTDREKKLVVALCVAVLCLLAVILVKGEAWFNKESSSLPIVDSLSQQPKSWSDERNVQATPPKREANLSVLVIDVKGAVKKPGIYQLRKPARIYQVIEAAGGSASDADLSKLNLAQEVIDGSVIYIPRKGEENPPTFFTPTDDGTSRSVTGQSGKISVNSASAKELEELPGVGPAKAEAIIQYREQNGPFQRVSDVAKVPGIGEKLLERFQDLITVP